MPSMELTLEPMLEPTEQVVPSTRKEIADAIGDISEFDGDHQRPSVQLSFDKMLKDADRQNKRRQQ